LAIWSLLKFFGTLAYGNQQAENDYDTTPLEETLLALQEEINRGRIRYILLKRVLPSRMCVPPKPGPAILDARKTLSRCPFWALSTALA
jgi:hypothetical protein